MNSSREFDRLQHRLDRLERELGEVRAELAALAESEEVAVVEAPPPAMPFEVAPVAVPPPLPAVVPVASVTPRREDPVASRVEPESEGNGPDWRDWLRSIQLWPPAGEGDAEVRLGAWWATRVGALLAVIGVVFFGIYVSVNTAPWVKFLELLAIAVGVTAGGFWLERKLERFGAVVAAGGLALIYFSAFAAHAVPAVRMVESPLAAGGWQLAAVALILVAALWRRSTVIATLAVGLGGVTAFLAQGGGFAGFALFTVGLLAVVAVVFARLRRWEAPSVLALPAVNAVYLAVWADHWRGVGAPAGGLAWWFLGGVTCLFFARDWRRERVTEAEVTTGERWFQGGNSSLAALSGVVTALSLYRGELEWFYFGAAVFFAALAVLRRRQVEGDLVAALLLAKATGALTLGVIELTTGRTLALALLVQAAVLAWTARRIAARVLAWGAGVVAVIAAAVLGRDALAGAQWVEAAAPVTVFLVGGLWLAALALRQWWSAGAARAWEIAAGLAAGGLAVAAVGGWQPALWAPAQLAVLGLVLAASAWWRRSEGFLIAGGLALAAAQPWLWQGAWNGADGLWLNAAVVLSPLAVAAWVWGRHPAGLAVGAVALLGLAQVAHAELSAEVALAGCAGLGVVLAAVSPWTGGRRWQALAVWATVLGVSRLWPEAAEISSGWALGVLIALWVLPVLLHESARHRAEASGADRWVRPAQLGLAVAAGWRLLPELTPVAVEVLVWSWLGLGLAALRAWRGLPGALSAGLAMLVFVVLRMDRIAYGEATEIVIAAGLAGWAMVWVLRADERRWARVSLVVLATVVSMQAADVALRGADRLWLLAGFVGVAGGLCRWWGVRAARPAAVVLAALALGQAVWLVGEGRVIGWGWPAATVATTGVAAMLLPLLIARRGDELEAGTRGALQWLCGAAGVFTAGLLVWRQPPPLEAYVTVGWGAVAILVFAIGLLARLRSHRLLGLMVLAVCVPRVFVVDLNSMLHRIIAFIALGVVLLWVGFSYHRFRHLIAGEDKETSS